MRLLKNVLTKKDIVCLGSIAAFAVAAVFHAVLADSGPSLRNVNPQGTVTASSVKITLDTDDLARCRYSTEDTGYESMGNDMSTPDGLYHSGAIGTLGKGAYTYYVRCKDFEGNANNTSTEVSFTVGEITCVGANCPVVTPPVSGTPPVLSNFSPTGTVYNKYATLSVSTDKAATCRYSWYDKEYDSMTLAFTSNNKLYHVASATLAYGGNYNYYVRCKDESGNINSPAGKILFYYYVAPATPVVKTPVVTTPADTAPPSISGLSPSGTVDAKEITLALSTDETASCRYGKSDLDYDLLADSFVSSGTDHSAQVTLGAPGEYAYYVRCEDAKGNQNTVSGQIEFTYAAPEGVKISDLQPSGVIYQNTLALIATTDKAASCRFSENNVDYDQMGDFFDTNDGFLHQATVDLPDYGFYSYYVRCTGKDGVPSDKYETINFEYQNPNPEEVVPDETSAPLACEQIQIGAKDGVCDNTQDCICDPDCPASGEDADLDCANVVQPSGGGSWVALLFIGLILLIIVVIVIIIIKRRGGEDEDVELP